MAKANAFSISGTERSVTQDARALLSDVVCFLKHSGLSDEELVEECRAALKRTNAARLRVKVVHIDRAQEGSNIVNRWLRDPAYLNRSGKPADLPIHGVRSVASLIRDCQGSISTSEALALLSQYGNVKKVGRGKYRLVKRLMHFGHAEYETFEPNFKFLCDATNVTTKKLGTSNGRPGLFWHCADNVRISPTKARRFLQFAQERSLSFMHEMNDWLNENEAQELKRVKRANHLRRVGVGLFGICSDSR
jgi:hypothetical protein